ncbi:hypothetical protein [Legionella drancourtii]|uniref:Uncharacterized protein n=1 Tax=Legionella drancourtii LLAP12 TaxID=658187 RepID=G9EL10_9GAMM|nr:hypothetical protein [Legionella drancourtii]EHL32023.1 hypothetical protein LDG_5906 [Legionella drancourtii LLAP12]
MLDRIEVPLKDDNLTTVLSEQFPLNTCAEEDSISSRLYLVSNELRYRNVIKALKNIEVNTSNQIRVGLLVGESNILSFLPHLAGICDLVLMTDIEPRIAIHNRHMIDCMLKTKTPAEFLNLYTENHPLKNRPINFDGTQTQCSSTMFKNLISGESIGGCFHSSHTVQKESLGEYFFLNNAYTFMQCKHALLALPLLQIKLNISDENECSAFAKVLQMHQGRITFCNLSNIHYTVSVEKLRTTVPLLLTSDPDGCRIMFSEHAVENSSSLHTTLTEGIESYLQAIEQNKLISLKEQFGAKKSCSSSLSLFPPPPKSEQTKKPQNCYVGFYDMHNRIETKFIQKIINGKENINDYSYMLHAYSSFKEAQVFIEKIIKEDAYDSCKHKLKLFARTNNKANLRPGTYWIFTVEGTVDKINTLLRYLPDNGVKHCPNDQIYASQKFSQKIISVIDNSEQYNFTGKADKESVIDQPVHQSPFKNFTSAT